MPVNTAKAVNQLKLLSEARSLMNRTGLQLPNKLKQDVLADSISDLYPDVNETAGHDDDPVDKDSCLLYIVYASCTAVRFGRLREAIIGTWPRGKARFLCLDNQPGIC